MSKKFLSLLLVLCMLLPLVPTMALPVFAADGDSEPVVYKYADAANANFTRDTTSKLADYTTANGVDIDGYKAWLESDEAYAIKQNDPNWKAGAIDKATATLTPFTRVAFFAVSKNGVADGTPAWSMTDAGYKALIPAYLNAYNASTKAWSDHNANIWSGYNLFGQHAKGDQTNLPNWCGVTNSGAALASGMQFTATVAGEYTIALDLYNDTDAEGQHTFSILKKSGDTVTTLLPATYKASVASAVAALVPVELAVGDTVTFAVTGNGDPCYIKPVVTKIGGNNMVAVTLVSSQTTTELYKPGDKITLPDLPACLGWDDNGDGEIDYLEGDTYTVTDQHAVLTAIEPGKTVFKSDSTHPTWDGSKIIFHDNWSIGHIIKATGVYAPVAYKDDYFLKVNSNGPWYGNGLGLYHNRNRIVFSGSEADGAYTPTIRYTAPYTGTVSLSYDMLNAVRQVSDGDQPDCIEQGYAIYVGGQKVWPTEGAWYMYTGETTYPSTGAERNGSEDVLAILKKENGDSFAVTVPVKEGDFIEFRTLQGNSMTYHTEQQPTVTYTSIVSDHWGDDTSTSFVSGFGGSLSLDTTKDSATYGKAILPAGWKLVSRKTSGYSDAEKYMDTLVVDTGAAFTGKVTINTWFAESGYPFGNNTYPADAGYPVVGWYGDDRNGWWLGSAEIISNANYAAGYQYTATAEGYVDISIDRLIQNYASTGANVYAAVFVDGVMIWPNVGGSYTQKSDWFSLKANSVAGDRKVNNNNNYEQEEYAHKLGDTSGLSGVYVKAGDKIELLFQNGGGGSGTWADITITEYPFATEFVKAVVDGTSRQFVDVVYAGQDATALYSQLDTYLGWDMDNDGEADLANGGTIENVTETTFITAIRAGASRFDKNLPFVYENSTFTYDESNTDWSVGKADWNVDFTVDKETKLTLGSVVTKLDTQYPGTNVLYDGTPGIGMYDIMNGGGIYNNRKWVIRQPVSQKAVGAFYTAPYSGVVDLDYSDIKGHWELDRADAHFFVTVGDTAYYAYHDDRHNTDATFFYVKKDARENEKITLVIESGVTEYYTYTDTDEDGTPDTMVLTPVTADTQGEKQEVYQQVYAGVYLAIVHNGEVIWPSNHVPFLYKSDEPNSRFIRTQGDTTALAKAREYEPFPTNLRVEAGDTIAFVANTDHVLNNMVYMDPMVTYTQVYDKAEAYATIDVNSNFSVNIYAGESDARASESGVVVTGQVDKILAKDMEEKITYQPYQIINGQRIDFAPKTITLADMLALYATQPDGVTEADANLADALYHYGYAAANYFDGDKLPGTTETLLASIQPDTSEEAKKVEASLEEGADRLYKILGATLMLEDELKMVFLVQTANGSAFSTEGLQLVINNALGRQVGKVGADAFTLPAEGGNDSQMLVSYTVPVSLYQEKLYFTILKDGDKASETVGYGVLTYVARKYEGGEGEADNLLRAIANITSPAPTFEAGLVKASDTATFKYCGTWEPSGDTMISHWNESYVEVDFYGTSVTPVFAQSSAFLYSIDGGSYTQATANGEYTITAQGEGEHTLRIKTTGRTNNVYFAGVQVESQYAIHRADRKAHYIHFVGDSISDDEKSFARRVGDELGWDYATTALSGIALETGYGYYNNSSNNPNMAAVLGNIGMEDAFFKYGIPYDDMTGETRERYLGYYTDPSLDVDYEAMAYKPDIVFIFLGTNDQLSNVENDKTRFANTYVEFVDHIKAAYGENTEIWVLQSLCTPTEARFGCISYAVALLTEKYGDDIHFIDWEEISTWGLTFKDDVHPDKYGYPITVEKVSAILKAHYNTEA